MIHLAEVDWSEGSSGPGGPSRTLENRLVAVRHARRREPGAFETIPVERLLLLHGTRFQIDQAGFAREAAEWAERATAFLSDDVLRARQEELREGARRTALGRRSALERGFSAREAELAQRRTKLRERAGAGDPDAREELVRVRAEQQRLASDRQLRLDDLVAGPERIAAGPIRWIARALVVPSKDPEERERHDRQAELIATEIVRAVEEARGATVRDVSTPPKARAANLTDHPGFDLLARYPDGRELAIEVKGRAGRGEIEVKQNEWAAAANHGLSYHLAVVFDCASPAPSLYRIVDPFERLLARQTGALRIPLSEIVANSEEAHG